MSKSNINLVQDTDAQGVGDVFDNLDALRVDQSYGSGLKTASRSPNAQSASLARMSGSVSAATW